MLTRISFEEIDQTIAAANAAGTELEAVEALCRSYAGLPAGMDYIARLDPFSREYRDAMLRVLALVTRRPDYQPARDEAANYLPASAEGHVPSVHAQGDSTWLGEFLLSYGSILKAMEVKRGARVLEYGAGEGQIAIQLARMGCDVTVVDIERRYLEIIRREATDLHTSVTTLHGQFGDAPTGATYDRILFFEAFHHALDHQAVLPRLRERLAPGGRILFAGEPIMEDGNYWSPVLPYPWGPRLDALSLRAMRHNGWCELGFARSYFVEALMRAGFVTRFHRSAATDRGSAYIAERHDGTIALGDPILTGASGRPDAEWHAGEGTHRWTAAEEAVLPLDQTRDWAAVTLQLANWGPAVKHVRAIAGPEAKEVTMQPGDMVDLTVPLRYTPGRLLLQCGLTRLADHGPTADTRSFGIAVRQVQYRPPIR